MARRKTDLDVEIPLFRIRRQCPCTSPQTVHRSCSFIDKEENTILAIPLFQKGCDSSCTLSCADFFLVESVCEDERPSWRELGVL